MYALSQKTPVRNQFDTIFLMILTLVFFVLFGTAYYLEKIKKQTYEGITNYSTAIKAQFIIEQKIPAPEIEKKVEPVKKIITQQKENEIVDLSEEPVLAQKEDVVEEQKPVDVKPVRRVYGLKKVYSQGLGAGGNLSDAVIGKLGNTINTEIDTFLATDQDLKGVLASSTTITKAPRFKKTAKPAYTKEMIENKLEGVVKLKVLVDIDGKVKKATVLSDIGFDSARQALDATKEMEFVPAMRGEEAVAVWIIIPIRFVIIS